MYQRELKEAFECKQDLEAEQVVHFDLKCDNILLEPLERPGDPDGPPFRVVLSDFGESRMYTHASSALTVR
jgi:serine/threonine protein kinase